MGTVNRIRAGLIAASALAVILLVFLVGFSLIGGPILNDIKAYAVERSLRRIELPPGTVMLESFSVCANASGTGSRVEIWAGILIRTDLAEKELESRIGYPCFSVREEMEKPFPQRNRFMDIFTGLQGLTDFNGYYIVYLYEDAVTQLDMWAI